MLRHLAAGIMLDDEVKVADVVSRADRCVGADDHLVYLLVRQYVFINSYILMACSPDGLAGLLGTDDHLALARGVGVGDAHAEVRAGGHAQADVLGQRKAEDGRVVGQQIGRASCRERVYVLV